MNFEASTFSDLQLNVAYFDDTKLLGFCLIGAVEKFQAEQRLADWLLMWTCADDCKYRCMWDTEESNKNKTNVIWKAHQYYGKVILIVMSLGHVRFK